MDLVTFVLRLSHRRFRHIQIATAFSLGFMLIYAFLYTLQADVFRSNTEWESGWKRVDQLWFQQPSCMEKQNLVYIKMIKCASTTLAFVLRRFGLSRNLTFVLPLKNRIYVGWPYTIDNTLYRPSKTGQFNILCEHCIYNRDILHRIMPSNTSYITSLREPFSQVKSTLNYYNVFNISGVKSADPLQEYLTNLVKYETVYKSPVAAGTRYCVPNGFSMTRNLMSYNLGFPTGFLPGTTDMSHDNGYIEEWIKKLDAEFQLVIITEYFYESMVLLRRMMCWTLQDILFSTSNQLKYGHKNQIDHTLVTRYKSWSRVDYVLYNHFNASLWKRLHQQNEDFWKEVQHFRQVNEAVNKFCDGHDRMVTLTIPASAWHSSIKISDEFCNLLQDDILPRLQKAHEEQMPQLVDPKPSQQTC